MTPAFYDERTARTHVRRVREIIVNPPVHITQRSNPYISEDAADPKRKNSKKSADSVSTGGISTPATGGGLMAVLHSKLDINGYAVEEEKLDKVPEVVRNINFSAWNPPPGNRQLRGDLLYLEVYTLEGNTLHVTCSVTGFFLNSSTREMFDPRPAKTDYKSHTLVELLKRASHGFSSKFSRLMNRRVTRHPFQIIAAPYETYEWLQRPKPHAYDWNRAEDTLLSTYGMEGARGVLRDWNEEYQCCREMPQTNLLERILYNRTKYRVYLDFRDAATKGAMAVVDGNIPPVNPMDEERSWVYLYNKIFFSLTIDGRDTYKNIGGDRVSHCNASHDILGITTLERSGVDIKLRTLATLAVDYRGHRVLAQSIIPGIFHGDQDSSHVYGAMETSETIKADPDFHKEMQKAAEKLHIKEHTLIDIKGNKVTLAGCVETKGIIGSDRRKYLLDLTRIFPRDANFPEYKDYPTALLRPELIDQYVCRKALGEIVTKRHSDQQKEEAQKSTKTEEETTKNDKVEPKPSTNSKADLGATPEKAKENKNKQSSDYSKELSKIRFNVDIYTDWKHADAKQEEEDKKEIQIASQFLLQRVQGLVLGNFRSLRDSPVDGESLTKMMHTNGINVRYLGTMTSLAISNRMPHVAQLCVQEMLVRSAKHVLNGMLRDVKPDLAESQSTWFLAPCIVRFLNSFLGPFCGGHGLDKDQLEAAEKVLELIEKGEVGEGQKKQLPRSKRRRKKSKKSDQSIVVRMPNGRKAPTDPLHPNNLWMAIHRLVRQKYRCKLALSTEFSARRKLCMLRSLCKKVGIKLACRNYNFDVEVKQGEEPKQIFKIDDVIGLFPIVKTIQLFSKDADDFMHQGKMLISRGGVQLAYAKLTEAQNIIHQTYGPMHEQAARCYSLLAMVCYRAQDIVQAVEMQQKALLVYKRILGEDHHQVAYAHQTMSLFLHSAGQPAHALKHITRALFLFELMCGPVHPDVGAAHINIAMIYQDTAKVPKGLAHLQRAKEVFKAVLGGNHPQVALCDHTIAVAHSLMGNFREAINSEKIAKQIYDNLKHPRRQECVQWLQWFTKNAVDLEKGSKKKGQVNLVHPTLSPFVWISLQKLLPLTPRTSDLVKLIRLKSKSAMRTQVSEATVTQGDNKAKADTPRENNSPSENDAPSGGTAEPLTKSQKKRLKRKLQKQRQKAAREEGTKEASN
ncbi:hypothetical protein AAMO2058_001467000 [Amorphochlora amoebiformis]